MNIQKVLVTLVAVLLLLAIAFTILKMNQEDTASYAGVTSNNQTPQATAANTETIVDANGQQKNIVVANDPAFNPRSFTAGGDGWLLSVTESQPKVFTGKLLANNGVDTYDLFLQEANNFYTGDAKSRKDGAKSEFSIQKQDGQCKDKEGTTFEYGVVALFQNQTLNGCGGNVVSTATVQ